jgi:hypothetical protein
VFEPWRTDYEASFSSTWRAVSFHPDSFHLQQVLAPQTLVNVIATNDYRYELRFFEQENGQYLTNGDPFVVLNVNVNVNGSVLDIDIFGSGPQSSSSWPASFASNIRERFTT